MLAEVIISHKMERISGTRAKIADIIQDPSPRYLAIAAIARPSEATRRIERVFGLVTRWRLRATSALISRAEVTADESETMRANANGENRILPIRGDSIAHVTKGGDSDFVHARKAVCSRARARFPLPSVIPRAREFRVPYL